MTGPQAAADGAFRRLTADEFRDVIGHFASGVTVITTVYGGQRFGTTASAVSSLSLEPPMVLICMNRQSGTGAAVGASRRFAVNILGEDQAELAVRFAGKATDKFAGVPVNTGACGQPLLEDAVATLECRVVEDVTGGTHTVFLAEVDCASAHGGAPLAYFRGQFGRLELQPDQNAYRDLRAAVLNRQVPVGEPLNLDRLATRFEIPRGPLYHALSKLTSEGLVRRNHTGAFVVQSLSFDAVVDSLRARAAIETGVAATMVGRLSAEQIAECRRLAETLRPVDGDGTPVSVEEWVRRLTAFQEHMVALAGSEALVEGYRRVTIPSLITQLRSGADTAPASIHRFHRALVDAYADGDFAAAREAIERRTEHTIDAVRRDIAAAGGEI